MDMLRTMESPSGMFETFYLVSAYEFWNGKISIAVSFSFTSHVEVKHQNAFRSINCKRQWCQANSELKILNPSLQLRYIISWT